MTQPIAQQSWESLHFSQVDESGARGLILTNWKLAWDTFAAQVEEIYESMPALQGGIHDVSEI